MFCKVVWETMLRDHNINSRGNSTKRPAKIRRSNYLLVSFGVTKRFISCAVWSSSSLKYDISRRFDLCNIDLFRYILYTQELCFEFEQVQECLHRNFGWSSQSTNPSLGQLKEGVSSFAWLLVKLNIDLRKKARLKIRENV